MLRLQRIEAVVQRQQGLLAEGDAGRLLLRGQHRGARLFGPIGASATEVRFRHFATVLGLMACRAASALRLA